LQQQLIWAVPGAMVCGLIWGIWMPSQWLKSAVIPLTFMMVYPMLVDLRLLTPAVQR
jgi:ACR3 family arsenite transporter